MAIGAFAMFGAFYFTKVSAPHCIADSSSLLAPALVSSVGMYAQWRWPGWQHHTTSHHTVLYHTAPHHHTTPPQHTALHRTAPNRTAPPIASNAHKCLPSPEKEARSKTDTSVGWFACTLAEPNQAGDAAMMKKCIKGDGEDAKGQQWTFDKENKRFFNVRTKLCMDSMRFDKKTYPEAQRDNKYPITMQPCGKSTGQRLELWRVDVEENAKHANVKRSKGQY
jgi:hypothetical protein